MNIYTEFEKAAAGCLGKTAMLLIHDDGTSTQMNYRRTLALAKEFAAKLKSYGVSKGQRVAIAAESSPLWNTAFMAVLSIDCTAALIDYSLPADEMLALIRKAEVSCVIASEKVYAKLGAPEGIPILDIDRALAQFAESCPRCEISQPVSQENAAVIIFSSGTTKTASGIVHSHDSLINSARMCLDCNHLGKRERYLGLLPNSHIYGLFAQVLAPMLWGAQVGFVENLTAKGLQSGFESFRPTVVPAVPKIYELLKNQIMKKIESDKRSQMLFKTMFPVCLKARMTSGVNLGKAVFGKIHDVFGGKVKILCSAGSPMSRETCEFYYGTGFNILNSYGTTETNIPTIGNYGRNITVDSAGRPYPDVRIKIAPSGEILLKSPYFMLGYYGDEEATKAAYTSEGWFKTGDLGEYNKRGNIVILGRCKENIVLSTGKKAAPDDIEKAYSGIKGVKELVVCGVPVEDGSYDEVHAFVVADPLYHSDIYNELMKLSSGLAAAMRLNGVHFVESIPRTSLQKPKRYLLKKMVLEDSLEKLVDNDKKAVKTDSSDIAGIVINAVAKIGNVPPEQVKLSTKFLREFTIDSLSTVELALEIEDLCGVKIDDSLDKDMTVAKLIGIVQNPKMIKTTPVHKLIYPLNKSALDYRIYRFYRNLVRAIYKVRVKNEEVLPEDRGYIICANHVSNFDYLYLTQNFKQDRFRKFCCMAKKELFSKNPVSRLLVKVAGMIPVDRTGAVGDAMDSVKAKLKDKWGVLIHPEGTRSKDGKLGKFKNGAALLSIETRSPIIPAYIKGGHEIYPPSRKLPKLFNWKKLRKYDVEVVYGDPIDPEGMTPETLTAKVQAAVEALAKKSEGLGEKLNKRKFLRRKKS